MYNPGPIVGSTITSDQMKRLDDFVKESTKIFDDSHNHEHAEIVYRNMMDIVKSSNKPYPEDILTYAAKLHDVRDHKYPNSIPQQELENFVYQELGHVKGKQVLYIIENVSYSKEIAQKCNSSDELHEATASECAPRNGHEATASECAPRSGQEYLTIIRDADRLEALGEIGLKRCIQITELRGGKVPQDVIKHCYEKLLRLYPEYFIKTPRGRELALPRHQVIVDYVKNNSE